MARIVLTVAACAALMFPNTPMTRDPFSTPCDGLTPRSSETTRRAGLGWRLGVALGGCAPALRGTGLRAAPGTG